MSGIKLPSHVDYRELVNTLSDIVIIIDSNGRFEWVSPQVKEILGFDQKEVLGKDAFKFIHREDLGKSMEGFQEALEKGTYSMEYRARHKNGHFVHLWGVGKVVIDDNDMKIIGHIREISDRKATEEELRESKNFLSGILSSIQDGISVLDTNLRIQYVNPVMEKWYSENVPLFGKHCYKCYQGRDEPCQPCPSLRALKTGNTEFDVVPGPPDSSDQWMELYSYPLKDPKTGNVTGIIEFVRDISDRMKVEMELHKTNERFKLASDSAGIGVWDLDISENKLKWDDWMFRIYGMKREDFTSDFEAWQNGIHPDDFQEAIDSVNRSIETGEDFDKIFRIIRPNGEVRWIKANARVMKDKNAKPVRMIGTNHDITEEIRAKNLLESEKERAEFYLDLLAHDLGNIHQGLSGAIQMIDNEMEKIDKTYKSVDLAKDSVRKALELTKNVMLLSRVRAEKPALAVVDVSSVIEDAFHQVKAIFQDKDIILDKDLHEYHIMADSLLKEVFQNLFHNSIRLQESPWVHIGLKREGNEVRIEISDKGPGIPDNMKKDLFRRYGIKNSKTRTGLGLSIVRALVERYGGEISVDDRIPGDHSKGAVFTIRFPAID